MKIFTSKMGPKQIAINSAKVLIGSAAFLSTFYTMIELMYFLSEPNYNRTKQPAPPADYWLSISWGLFVNMALLSLFVLQHSVLVKDNVKHSISKLHLEDTYRSIYVLLTVAALQILMRNWQDIPQVAFWRFNLGFRPFWWVYASIHAISWLIIYIGNICMDVNELLGVKQIYYRIMDLPDPNSRKSNQLQRLNSHMRHPSFLAFVLIFWTVPVMSLDRLLLATIFTLYMFITWNPDDRDYSYQKAQYTRKFFELERLQE